MSRPPRRRPRRYSLRPRRPGPWGTKADRIALAALIAGTVIIWAEAFAR